MRAVYIAMRIILSKGWSVNWNKSIPQIDSVVSQRHRTSDEVAIAMANIGGLFTADFDHMLNGWDGCTGLRRDSSNCRLVFASLIDAKVTDTSTSYSEVDQYLLERLGLDMNVGSSARRRLATYYAIGMLVNMQVESNGLALRLPMQPRMTGEDFKSRMDLYGSFVIEEAQDPVEELVHRFNLDTKYRYVPSGFGNNDCLPVEHWVQCLLINLLNDDILITSPTR